MKSSPNAQYSSIPLEDRFEGSLRLDLGQTDEPRTIPGIQGRPTQLGGLKEHPWRKPGWFQSRPALRSTRPSPPHRLTIIATNVLLNIASLFLVPTIVSLSLHEPDTGTSLRLSSTRLLASILHGAVSVLVPCISWYEANAEWLPSPFFESGLNPLRKRSKRSIPLHITHLANIWFLIPAAIWIISLTPLTHPPLDKEDRHPLAQMQDAMSLGAGVVCIAFILCTLAARQAEQTHNAKRKEVHWQDFTSSQVANVENESREHF